MRPLKDVEREIRAQSNPDTACAIRAQLVTFIRWDSAHILERLLTKLFERLQPSPEDDSLVPQLYSIPSPPDTRRANSTWFYTNEHQAITRYEDSKSDQQLQDEEEFMDMVVFLTSFPGEADEPVFQTAEEDFDDDMVVPQMPNT